MIERLSNLPKGDPRRNAIAKQLRDSRAHERNSRLGSMTIDRSGKEYTRELKGLAELFSYVRTLKSNKILDIGSGTTIGISDLSKSGLGEGLTFEGTVLKPNVRIEKNLGKHNVHHTEAESLRGVEDNSIGGVITLYSVTYTKDPELVVSSVDRVLVPGGVFKGLFFADMGALFLSLTKFFNKLGYDIAYRNEELGTPYILVAIKPDIEAQKSAAELLREDWASTDEQIRLLRKPKEASKSFE